MEDRIVTLERYSDPILAEIILGRLKANDIDCFIADENTIGANPLFNKALGGVKIKVFERDIEKCREILAQNEALQADEPAPEMETTCPYCHSTNMRYGMVNEKKTNWIGRALSFLNPAYGSIQWHCFNCGKDFE